VRSASCGCHVRSTATAGDRFLGHTFLLITHHGRNEEELSERELAVLRLVATELTQREIGDALYVSFNTIRFTSSIVRKLDVTTRPDAVSRARVETALTPTARGRCL
jgi:ATP/maltotriose-dependent transcriptional regulator MalT